MGRRVKSPVILGCNALRAIAEKSMEPMWPSREDWRLALRWIQLVGEPESGSSEGLTTVDTTLSVPFPFHNVDTCAVTIMCAETREAVSIPHGEVTVLQCRVSLDNASLEGRPMLMQALDTMDTPLYMIEGIQQIKDGPVEVVVANPGPDTVTLPAATQIVTVQEVTATDQVVILPTSEKLTVSVQQVMVESSEDASLHTRLLQSNQPQVDEINTSPVVFSFPDGTQYTLPPGLQLDGLEPEDAIRLAALVRQYDSVFSKGSTYIGRCDLIPHEIRVNDPGPVHAAYRRVPPHMVDEVNTL